MKKKPTEGWRKQDQIRNKKSVNTFSDLIRNSRNIRVFQSQASQVHHAHGCPATNEDEEGDELVGIKQEKLITMQIS